MAIFKCKMCGGDISFEAGESVGTCEFCGTKQTLPRLDSDQKRNLYDRANHFRRNNEYDKAISIYEQILSEDSKDSEAYWSLVLCNYGIEYVEDPTTHKRVPTVNRVQFTSIFDDDNYKSAIHYSDALQRTIYEQEANTINEIQKGILAISQEEEPFDVFICYKETDDNGNRTPESVLATDIYYLLTKEGFKVFFSRITLEDKLGTAYEPYIFAALNSAKVMLVLGTKKEYFYAAWVRNEWSRFLALVKKSHGMKTLIPAYKDMDPYDLPEEFSHLQAQDMSKLGFMQDLIYGIKKIIGSSKDNVVSKINKTVEKEQKDEEYKTGFAFLEAGLFKEADDYFTKEINSNPQAGLAYLGKLMAEMSIKEVKLLSDGMRPLENNQYFKNIIKFSDKDTVSIVKAHNDRIIEKRKLMDYNDALKTMKAANSDRQFKSASNLFRKLKGFKDSDQMVLKCEELEKACAHNDPLYANAIQLIDSNQLKDLYSAVNIFNQIRGWRNTNSLIDTCQNKIEEIKRRNRKETIKVIIIIIIVIAMIIVALLRT